MSITVSILNNNTDTFNLNMTNSNFSMVWSALGLNPEAYDMRAPTLLDLLKCARPELMGRSTVREGNYINIGIDANHVKYYLTELTKIAKEACKREELIVWG